MKILLAEDDSATRELAARTLKSDGHEVTEVADGIAALDALEASDSFDLLFADVDMPGHDGLTVAKKAREGNPDIGVLLMSAHDSQLARSSEIGGGKVEVLLKPFALEALRATVAKLSS